MSLKICNVPLMMKPDSLEYAVLDRVHYDINYKWTLEELCEYFDVTKPRMLKCFRNLEDYGEIEFEGNVITKINE